MVTVDVFTLGYNEECILPHFINHYKQFCRNITFYNNCSTDNSVDICKSMGVNVIDTNLNELNDVANIAIKNNSYQKSNADFVIVVDTDELVYHPNIIKLLKYYKKNNITLPKVRGYTMASEKGYPKNDELLINHVKTGIIAPNYAKRCIFNPKLSIAWTPGQHGISKLNGLIVESEQQDISILHYKFLSLEEQQKKAKAYSQRMSVANKASNLGSHYNHYNEEKINKWFQEHIEAAITVI